MTEHYYWGIKSPYNHKLVEVATKRKLAIARFIGIKLDEMDRSAWNRWERQKNRGFACVRFTIQECKDVRP